MTYAQAIARAIKRAKETGADRHVVLEDEDYHVATDFDMDSFWLGACAIGTAGPDGHYEEAA